MINKKRLYSRWFWRVLRVRGNFVAPMFRSIDGWHLFIEKIVKFLEPDGHAEYSLLIVDLGKFLFMSYSIVTANIKVASTLLRLCRTMAIWKTPPNSWLRQCTPLMTSGEHTTSWQQPKRALPATNSMPLHLSHNVPLSDAKPNISAIIINISTPSHPMEHDSHINPEMWLPNAIWLWLRPLWLMCKLRFGRSWQNAKATSHQGFGEKFSAQLYNTFSGLSTENASLGLHNTHRTDVNSSSRLCNKWGWIKVKVRRQLLRLKQANKCDYKEIITTFFYCLPSLSAKNKEERLVCTHNGRQRAGYKPFYDNRYTSLAFCHKP